MKKGCKQENSLPFATFFIAGMKYHIMLYFIIRKLNYRFVFSAIMTNRYWLGFV